MSAGATVVASDLGAFSRVLDDGAAGRAVPRPGDSADLAATLVRVLRDPDLRARRLRARAARSCGSTTGRP